MGVKSETINNMKKFAEMLQGGEMTEKEAWQKLGMSQPRFKTLVTSMTERYLIYEYHDEKKHLIYGLLK